MYMPVYTKIYMYVYEHDDTTGEGYWRGRTTPSRCCKLMPRHTHHVTFIHSNITFINAS